MWALRKGFWSRGGLGKGLPRHWGARQVEALSLTHRPAVEGQNLRRGLAQTPGKAGLGVTRCLIITFLFPKLFPRDTHETGSERPGLDQEQSHVWGVARWISSGTDLPSLPQPCGPCAFFEDETGDGQ